MLEKYKHKIQNAWLRAKKKKNNQTIPTTNNLSAK